MTKPLMWLAGEVKTPPMSVEARRELGFLLRRLQEGEIRSMPESRPMPSIGKSCHELRVNDENKTWRLIYMIDPQADRIVVLDVIEKKTRKTAQAVIDACIRRRKSYETFKRNQSKE